MMQAEQLEAHRVALTGHCYRMLGSVAEADDAVQETLVRAWRASDGFEQRSSVKTWLVRIATNVCLDELSRRQRRARPMDLGPAGTIASELEQLPDGRWLEPIADAASIPAADPHERTVLRQSVRLAFVAALQHLPAKQRAALLMTQVLGMSAAETAGCLDTSVAAVNSALQRARATLEARGASLDATAALDEPAQELLERYLSAFERYDVAALTSLMHEDAVLNMPPYTLWLRGLDTIREWLLGPGIGCRGSRLIPVEASGSPAFGQYRPDPDGGHSPWALIVLDVAGGRVATMTSFLDTERLFPRFGLPEHLEREG